MPYIPNEALTREQGEQIIDVLKGEEPKEYGYPYTNEVLNKEQGDRIIKALKNFHPSGSGLPDPSTLSDGTALVAVNGEWKMQEGYGWIEENITTITWDGNIEGKTVVEIEEGVNLVLMSDETPSSIIGGTVKCSDGFSYNITSEDVISGEWGYIIPPAGDVTVIFEDGTTVDELGGITFEHKGVYFISISESEYGYYISSLTYDEPDTIHKIDEKYLPEGGIGWTEQGKQTVITWDGDTEGKTVVEAVGGGNHVLMSDETPSSIIGGTVVLSDGFSYNITSEDVAFSGKWGYKVSGDVTVIFEDGATVDGVTFEHKGVYFFYDSETSYYVSSLTYVGDVVHKIDQKYIPDKEKTRVIVTNVGNDEWEFDAETIPQTIDDYSNIEFIVYYLPPSAAGHDYVRAVIPCATCTYTYYEDRISSIRGLPFNVDGSTIIVPTIGYNDDFHEYSGYVEEYTIPQ